MKVHRLKVLSKHMRLKALDMMRWEMRRNDRGFREGDYVVYIEVDGEGNLARHPCFAGNLFRIDSVMGHGDVPDIPDGFVVWSESRASDDPWKMVEALHGMAK